MLLQEILSKSSLHIPNSTKQVSDVLSPKHHTLIGYGTQSIAYNHKSSNKIIKTVNLDGPADPIYQFLRLCIKHQNNPFLPKIYKIKIYNSDELDPHVRNRFKHAKQAGVGDMSQPSRRKYTAYVTMEKLQRYTSNISTPENIRKWGLESIIQPEIDAGHFSLQIKYMFQDDDYRPTIIKKCTNPMLKQALRLLEPLFNHYTPDVHSMNIMIRPPDQLVLMDPIS